MSRISLVREEDLPEEYVDLISAYTSSADLPPELRHLMSTKQRNIFRTVGHLPPVLETFRELGGRLWDEVDITDRERELLILTAAATADLAYVWHQHVRIAQLNNISREEIQAISDGEFGGFPESERPLLEFTAAYVSDDVDDDVFGAVADRYAEDTIVGLCLLASFYEMIGSVTDALAVDFEEEFAGWNGENWTRDPED